MKEGATPQPSGSSRDLRAVAILPARLASSRLPRKVLLRDTGRYLFEHTARRVEQARSIARVVVATDTEEVSVAAREVGLEALPTAAEHPSGTDRVHEAWQRLAADGERAEVVVNVQSDEPEIDPGDLDRLVGAFADPEVEVATLWGPLEDEAEASSPQVVKVVLDARGDALYFSRAPIPDRAHARPDAEPAPRRRHVGVYAFRPAALAAFCALAPGALERQESLEQLRWLEAGRRMRVVRASHVPRGVDTPEDYRAFVARQQSPSPQSSESPTPT